MKLTVLQNGKGIKENREPKAQLLSAAAREDRRIEIANFEREVRNAQCNVPVRLAEVIATRQRIKELTAELSEAKAELPRRVERHKESIRKAEQLAARLETMKASH